MRLLATLAIVLVSGCASVEARRLNDAAAKLTAAVKPARTVKDLSMALGRGPTSCVPSSPTVQLCTWTIDTRQSPMAVYGAGVAMPVSTGHVWRVICEMPADGSPRADETCSIVPNLN